MANSALDAFEESTFTYEGNTKPVYRAGTGPGVVVIHELPGLTPNVAAFARKVVDAGFTVAAPVLAGSPGKTLSVPYALRSMTSVCISKEFTTWATNRTSPVIEWLRALARDLHATAGGPGVGAIGMCFSGGFALAMAVDDVMLAPVCSQPSLPFAVGKKRARDLGLSQKDAVRLQERADLCVLAMRFTGDRFVPAARFEALRELLGDRVIAIEIDSSKGNPHNISRISHSVVTEHFVDEPGHPTKDALERVLGFFRERLATP